VAEDRRKYGGRNDGTDRLSQLQVCHLQILYCSLLPSCMRITFNTPSNTYTSLTTTTNQTSHPIPQPKQSAQAAAPGSHD
jgi:hypothetical protein